MKTQQMGLTRVKETGIRTGVFCNKLDEIVFLTLLEWGFNQTPPPLLD